MPGVWPATIQATVPMPSNSFLLAQVLFFGKVTKDRFAAWQRLHTTPPEHMPNNNSAMN